MNRKRRIFQALCFLAITAASLCFVSGTALAVPVCGPGPHWVDSCSGGLDTFPSIATVGVDTDLNDSEDFSLLLSGPTTVFRSDPLDTPDPLDPGHLNTIPTEIVALSLTGAGFTLIAGDGIGNLTSDGPLFTPGEITEQPDNVFFADSFFDVFFELQGTPFGPLSNLDPLRVEAVIGEVVPLGIPFTFAGPPVGLFDAGGTERLRITSVRHTPVPEPATLILLGIGITGAFMYMRKR